MTEPRERISERHFADYLLVLRKPYDVLFTNLRTMDAATIVSVHRTFVVVRFIVRRSWRRTAVLSRLWP